MKKPPLTPAPSEARLPFSPRSELGFAWRVGTEFISGICVGLLLGYAVDHVLGTKPWGLVALVILGAAAGILNIFRLVGTGAASSPNPVASSAQGEKKDG